MGPSSLVLMFNPSCGMHVSSSCGTQFHLKHLYLHLLYTSDEQGFGNPCRYTGKGTVGMGRGKNLWTLAEPLPSVWVMGYLHSSSTGRVSK